MKTFQEFLAEARRVSGRATYSDEHATSRLWNHFIHDPKFQEHISSGRHDDAITHMRGELKKAREDKDHPLHFSKASHEGFSGGRRTRQHSHSYHRQLSRAVRTVHSIATSERRGSSSARQRLPMRVVGGTSAPTTKFWSKHTGKKKDKPKTDLEIYNPDNPKHSLTISKKQTSSSQVMSAEPNEAEATYKHALRRLQREMRKSGASREETIKATERLSPKISRAVRPLRRMSSERATPSRKLKLKRLAQRRLSQIHTEVPDISRHVGHEAYTGTGKFGRGAILGLVGHDVVDLTKKGKKGTSPPYVRAALGKGKGRPGTLRSSERRKRL